MFSTMNAQRVMTGMLNEQIPNPSPTPPSEPFLCLQILRVGLVQQPRQPGRDDERHARLQLPDGVPVEIGQHDGLHRRPAAVPPRHDPEGFARRRPVQFRRTSRRRPDPDEAVHPVERPGSSNRFTRGPVSRSRASRQRRAASRMPSATAAGG